MERQEVSNMHPTSADIIGNNDDILINILVHLPEKSLLRFQNVSKHWFSLMSSDYFSTCRHQGRVFPSGMFLKNRPPSKKPEYYFLSLNEKPIHKPFIRSLCFVDDASGIKILQSCNGLLLCRSNSLIAEKNRNYYIYNPTTDQYTTLPKYGHRIIINTVFGVFLAFDPTKSKHYKVVFVRSSETSPRLYQLEIYSSETGCWSFSSEFSKVKFSTGVYCNGSIHWMMMDFKNLQCFNVEQETFHEIPMPEIPEDWNQQIKFRYFGEFGGYLHLILTNANNSSRQFDVYQMNKNTSRWFVKYQVDLNDLISAYPEMTRSNFPLSDWDFYVFRVLAVVCKESEQGSFMVLHLPGKVISYNFQDKTSSLLHDFAPGCSDIVDYTMFEFEDTYAYIETFFMV